MSLGSHFPGSLSFWGTLGRQAWKKVKCAGFNSGNNHESQSAEAGLGVPPPVPTWTVPSPPCLVSGLQASLASQPWTVCYDISDQSKPVCPVSFLP